MIDFNSIREMYRKIDPKEYNPYPIDWSLIFTPIEARAWDAIRYRGIPFWPQYPIGKYFADFADPLKKIVVECDGKEFHAPGADVERDNWMIGEGWKVFRISGADCNRIIDPPWERLAEGDIEKGSAEHNRILEDWYMRTVDGLMSAIWRVYYCENEPDDFTWDVLRERMSATRTARRKNG